MSTLIWPGLVSDLLLICALVFGVYQRRHHKRHMVVPYLGINIGVFAVGGALLGAEVGIGVGIGLFGVLSIIRLRSDEISHPDVSYYFASLAIGLVCAIPLDPLWAGPALGLLVVAVMALIDQPAWYRRYRHEIVVLDRILSRDELDAHLLDLLGAEQLTRVEITMTDLIRDSQTINVSYRIAGARDRERARDQDRRSAARVRR